MSFYKQVQTLLEENDTVERFEVIRPENYSQAVLALRYHGGSRAGGFRLYKVVQNNSDEGAVWTNLKFVREMSESESENVVKTFEQKDCLAGNLIAIITRRDKKEFGNNLFIVNREEDKKEYKDYLKLIYLKPVVYSRDTAETFGDLMDSL
jgi:hypothetical protein